MNTKPLFKKPDGFGKRIVMDLPNVEGLIFGECLGHGHFSHVYKCEYHGIPVAVKIIERGSDQSTENEVKLLLQLRNCPYIINLIDVKENEQTLLIFEFIQSMTMDYFFNEITIFHFRSILKKLLEALDIAHSKNIIHRDVKLTNIMIFDDFSDIRLIDWGCGCIINNEMSSKAGSRSCRSPEMLIGYKGYGKACDLWAVGIFILYVMSDGYIPWNLKTDQEALTSLTHYFGSDSIISLCHRYDLPVPPEVHEGPKQPIFSIESIFSSDMSNLQRPQLINLMKSLLVVDPDERLNSSQALQHPFLKP